MRITVRGWGDGALIFQETLEVTDEHTMMRSAMEQIDMISPFERCCLEIEFLDETNPLERFYRFGTDTSRMVMPARIT